MGAIEFQGYYSLDGIYPIEPDGKGGHFILFDLELFINQLPSSNSSSLDSNIYSPISVTIDVNISWPDPILPDDLREELIKSEAKMIWDSLTAKAMWDWIRWIRSSSNSNTRNKRIQTASSMLLSGKRRPCCFNTTLCTLPSVSKSGLLDNQ